MKTSLTNVFVFHADVKVLIRFLRHLSQTLQTEYAALLTTY